MSLNIGFIGLGNMGLPMCANLAKAGHKVRAFDLNTGAVTKAVEAGAIAAFSVAETVKRADVVISMLPAGEHVNAVYFGEGGVAESAKKGALLIDCSTIAVTDARNLIGKAETAGFQMIDAPVSGGTVAAEAGTLTFMVGGKVDAFHRAETVLKIMGKNIFHAGDAGNGQAAKVANNMLLGISMIGTCEAFNLAEKLGLDAQTFYDISSKASGQCWSMTSYCPAPGPVATAPSNNDYQPGFSVAMMLKDLKLAQDASSAVNASTELGKHAEEFYQTLADEGHDSRDFSIPFKKVRGII